MFIKLITNNVETDSQTQSTDCVGTGGLGEKVKDWEVQTGNHRTVPGCELQHGECTDHTGTTCGARWARGSSGEHF